MGVVYLATAQDGSQVAVKVLQPELVGDAEFRTRFGREVAALTRVRGVCTVRVIAADTTAARPFLVTEYADGPSLSEYVGARGPLDPQMLYGLAAGLAEALTAIHAAGIVHRDLKPSNVLLTAGGPKVIDFGIAQALDATAVTRTGMTIGSAGYMAPEQIMGRAVPASDIFSWAVTIAYAASGQPPFGSGTSHVILYRILHGTPDIAAVPATLRSQVTAALAKEPQARPTAPELLSQLTSTVAQPSAGAANPTQTLLAQTWRPPARPANAPLAPAARRSARPPADPPLDPAARRPGLSRPALVAIVVTVAILVGAGGAALALALGSRPATSSGAASGPTSQAQTAPATSNGSASPPSSTSPSSGSPSQTASSSASGSASSSASLPVLVVGSYTGMDPTEIAFSGDSTNVVTGLTWTWTATAATGTGTSDIDSCVPSCAAASPNPVTATITLSDPVDGHFTQMTETRNGSTTNYTYPGTWAQSAS